MTITAQALGLAEPLRDAPGAPGRKVPGYTGQGWSTHETMLVVRWLFAHPDVWDQAMTVARDPESNPHTVADTLHEKLVPRSELDAIAAQGFDPAKVNWLEIAHELIERRADPEPQEHATITEQALDLAAAVTVAPEAMQPPGLPVPDDPAAISIFTAHRTDEILHQLSHATERMTVARSASGNLRKYHAERLAGHLKSALDAGHDLTANIREHYPAEAAELEQVKESVGLAKAVSDNAKAATTAHLLETTLHELTHGSRHARQMTEDTPDDEWEFNADHAAKHLGGATEHAGKLRQHLVDNYPAESRWLEGLDEVTADAEDGGGKQHARYAKGDGGTITAQMANGETITGQMGDTLDLSPVTFDRRLISDDLIRDLGGDPEAQGLS